MYETGTSSMVPASTVFIFLHLPLYLYFVSLPSQSFSANWSITSAEAEVSVLRSPPRGR